MADDSGAKHHDKKSLGRSFICRNPDSKYAFVVWDFHFLHDATVAERIRHAITDRLGVKLCLIDESTVVALNSNVRTIFVFLDG